MAWGYMTNRWHDQGRVAHLLRSDNGPACGARFYASAGASSEVPANDKCLRCRLIEVRRAQQSGVAPCACGSTDASWHGKDGMRFYLCDSCWKPGGQVSPRAQIVATATRSLSDADALSVNGSGG